MSNQYRAVGVAAQAAYGTDIFDAEFTVEHERDLLGNGVLELAPRQYRVLVDNYQVPEGEVFEGAYPIEIEAALISGGVIERVRRDANPTIDEVVDETAPAAVPEPPKPPRRRTSNPPRSKPWPSSP